MSGRAQRGLAGRLRGNGGQEGSRQRGRGWSTSPRPSWCSQSPESVLVEVSTKDGAHISSEPEGKRAEDHLAPSNCYHLSHLRNSSTFHEMCLFLHKAGNPNNNKSLWCCMQLLHLAAVHQEIITQLPIKLQNAVLTFLCVCALNKLEVLA